MNDVLEAQLMQLSAVEKIELIAKLWNSIDDNDPAADVTPEQLAEARRRMEDYRRDPSSAIPIDEVIAHLRSRLS
ncbi:addiction module protein [Pseudorhodoplanes sp.]|uniref:addiction module protein n=1 Tax=Pseudorhodoplanes sp. TaxID=1934341 RepID=UPI00391DAA6C